MSEKLDIWISQLTTEEVITWRQWLFDNVKEENFKIYNSSTSDLIFCLTREEDLNLMLLQLPKHIHPVITHPFLEVMNK